MLPSGNTAVGQEKLILVFSIISSNFYMPVFFYIILYCGLSFSWAPNEPQAGELQLVQDLFRLRNEHKADSAELLFADTVQVYMKNLRNIPRKTITRADKQFWKAHPKNKFEITAPIQLMTRAGITTVIVYGKEYLDGQSFQYEKIEIRFNRHTKIYYYRGFNWKRSN